MSRLPFFKWYPADAECDANFRAMDDADIGFYIRCLNHSWINGSIPADPIERARVLRTRVDVANRRWERVAKSFVNSTLDRDRLVNPRQELERESATSRCIKATESANRRYNRSANAVPTQCEGSAIQIQSQIQIEPPKPPAPVGARKRSKRDSPLNTEQKVWFDSWYELYPKKESVGQAEKTFGSMVTDLDTARAVFVAIREQRDGMLQKIAAGERRFVPHPSTWISEKKWLDETAGPVVVSPVSQEPAEPVKCKPSFGDGRLESESWDDYSARWKASGGNL